MCLEDTATPTKPDRNLRSYLEADDRSSAILRPRNNTTVWCKESTIWVQNFAIASYSRGWEVEPEKCSMCKYESRGQPIGRGQLALV